MDGDCPLPGMGLSVCKGKKGPYQSCGNGKEEDIVLLKSFLSPLFIHLFMYLTNIYGVTSMFRALVMCSRHPFKSLLLKNIQSGQEDKHKNELL